MDPKKRFETIYEKAKTIGKLPWAHDAPTHFLDQLTEKSAPGTALDIGCGSGVDSIYLAKQGWKVTSLDFIADAVKMTAERANQAGVSLTLEEADITRWQCDTQFDLIIDAGTLHNMHPKQHRDYHKQLMSWLKPGGQLILVHFEKQSTFDWRPIGPRRWSREKIHRFMAPELEPINFHRHVVTGLPFIIGPSLSMATYWFKRKPS